VGDPGIMWWGQRGEIGNGYKDGGTQMERCHYFGVLGGNIE